MDISCTLHIFKLYDKKALYLRNKIENAHHDKIVNAHTNKIQNAHHDKIVNKRNAKDKDNGNNTGEISGLAKRVTEIAERKRACGSKIVGIIACSPYKACT